MQCVNNLNEISFVWRVPDAETSKRSRFFPAISEEDDDEIAKVETDLMMRLDNDIGDAEEREVLDKLNDQITQAEEIALIHSLLEQICDAEQREKAERSEKENEIKIPSLNEVNQNLDNGTDSEDPKDERLVKASKILPRLFRSSQVLVDEASISALQESFIKGFVSTGKSEMVRDFATTLNRIDDDTNSCRLTVKGKRTVVSEFLSFFRNWFETRLQSVNMAFLDSNGVEVSLTMTGSRKVGAMLSTVYFQRDNDTAQCLRLNPLPNEDSQLVQVVGQENVRGGAQVISIDDVPCSSINHFKTMIQKKEYKLVIRLSPHCVVTESNTLAILNKKETNLSPISSVSSPSQIARDRPGGSNSIIDTESKSANDSSRHRKTNDSYTKFKEKYKQTISTEYRGSGIHFNFVCGRMWHRHKESHFRNLCDDNCGCVFELPFLTETVVADHLQKFGDTWENPPYLSPYEYPVGLVGPFAKKFLPKLKVEHPSDNPAQLLSKLLNMWNLHIKIRAFGTRCNDQCQCEDGWDDVFHKGHPASAAEGSEKMPDGYGLLLKRTSEDTLEPDIQANSIPGVRKKAKFSHASTLLSCSHFDDRFRNDPNTERKEYSVSVDTSVALGVYCTNQKDKIGTSCCKIISVNPRGQCSKDSRIGIGSVVVAVFIDSSDRKKIENWQELRNEYVKAMESRLQLSLVLVNRFVDEKSIENTRKFGAIDWDSLGNWKGKCTSGWAGGARSDIETKLISAINKQSIANVRNPSNSEEGPAKVDLNESDWIRVDKLRHIKYDSSPKSIVKSSNNLPRARGTRVVFKETVEERRYEIGSRTCEFEVRQDRMKGVFLNGQQSHSPEGELLRTLEEGSFSDLISMLNDKRMSFIRVNSFSTVLQKLRDVVKSTLKSKSEPQRRDFILKDKILKTYIHAADAAMIARTLKNWTRFEIFLDSVSGIEIADHAGIDWNSSIKISVAAHYPDSGMIDEHLAGFPPRKLSKTIEFSGPDMGSYFFQHNSSIAAGRSLVFNIEITESPTSESPTINAGSVNLLMSLLQDKCPRNGGWCSIALPLPESPYLKSGLFKFRTRRIEVDPEYIKQKHLTASRRLSKVLEWVQRFNKEDLTDDERSVNYLSVALPVSGRITLLHSAVLLSDEHLVKRILAGSDSADEVTNRAIASSLSLALNMADSVAEKDTGNEMNHIDERRLQKRQCLGRISKMLHQAVSSPRKEFENCGKVNYSCSKAALNLDEILSDDEDFFDDPQKSDGECLVAHDGIQGGDDCQDDYETDENTKSSSTNIMEPRTAPLIHQAANSRETSEPGLIQDQTFDESSDDVFSYGVDVSLRLSGSWNYLNFEQRPLCAFFNKEGSCHFGSRCKRVHVQLQLGELLSDFHDYPDAPCTLSTNFEDSCHYRFCDSPNGRWYTVGYRDERKKEIYYCDRGPGGVMGDQKVWWYRSREAALKALQKHISVATYLREKGVSFLEILRGVQRKNLPSLKGQKRNNDDNIDRRRNVESEKDVPYSTLSTVQSYQPLNGIPEGAILPQLRSKQWLLTAEEDRSIKTKRCTVWQSKPSHEIQRCNKLHIKNPLKSKYHAIKNSELVGMGMPVPNFEEHSQVKLIKGDDGLKWYVAGYRHNNLIYYAEQGPPSRCRKNEQNIWLYRSPKDALAALRRVILKAHILRERAFGR